MKRLAACRTGEGPTLIDYKVHPDIAAAHPLQSFDGSSWSGRRDFQVYTSKTGQKKKKKVESSSWPTDFCIRRDGETIYKI